MEHTIQNYKTHEGKTTVSESQQTQRLPGLELPGLEAVNKYRTVHRTRKKQKAKPAIFWQVWPLVVWDVATGCKIFVFYTQCLSFNNKYW